MGAAIYRRRRAAAVAEILQVDPDRRGDLAGGTQTLSSAPENDPGSSGQKRMSLRFLPGSLPTLQLLLRCVAWLVPNQERVEWLAEWQGELWHAWHMRDRERAGRSSGGPAATGFCLGAFSDALWL